MIFILAKVQKLKFYVTTDHCNLEYDENIGFWVIKKIKK